MSQLEQGGAGEGAKQAPSIVVRAASRAVSARVSKDCAELRACTLTFSHVMY